MNIKTSGVASVGVEGLNGHRTDTANMVSFKFTDVGNSARLVKLFGDRLRYVKEWGWTWYDGIKWAPVDDVFVHGLAKLTLLSMEVEAVELGKSGNAQDRERGKQLGSWAYRCEFGYHTELMVKKARDGVRSTAADFNTQPWLFNALDCTVDLKTGEIREHRASDMITKSAGTNLLTPAVGFRWYAFLQEIFSGDQETIDYVQKVLGYALVDVTREEHFWLAWGKGRNGKTTLFEKTGRAMGDYAGIGNTEMIIDQGQFHSKNWDLATLVGARRVTFTETKEGQKLNNDIIKKLSGDDSLKVEEKFRMPYDFHPHFKMFLYTNHLPDIGEVGISIWSRLVVIRFNQCYDNKVGCLPPDLALSETLDEEMPAILRWLVEGAMKWQQDGLTAPKSVTVPTQDYQEAQDDLADFLRFCTSDRMEDPEDERRPRTKADDLYQALADWFRVPLYQVPIQKPAFGKKLVDHGYESRRSHGITWYHGIRLLPKEEWPKDEDEKPYGTTQYVLKPHVATPGCDDCDPD